MKFCELVTTLVIKNHFNTSWDDIAYQFGLTKDALRSRLRRFKDKYNITDSEVKNNNLWARDFVLAHIPDDEYQDNLLHSGFIPGNVFDYGNRITIVGLGGSGYIQDEYNRLLSVVLSSELYDNADARFKHTCEEMDVVYGNKETVVEIEPLQHLITPNTLIVVRDGQPLCIDRTHKNFERIQQALVDKSWQVVLDLIDMKTGIERFSNGRVTVQEGEVYLDESPVHGKLYNRLMDCLSEGNKNALTALTNYMQRCDENPDNRVVTRIYDFIQHNDLRLDQDGYILAYKVVRSDYLDKYTGTMDNSPGQVVSMKRNQVNPNDKETCSFGLHVAARAYIPQYGSPSTGVGGDRVVLCRVDPKDFVSIPTDYNSMKARVCSYTVIKDVTELFVKDALIEDDQIQA